MAPKIRLTPTLFDKIISGSELTTGRTSGSAKGLSQSEIGTYSVANVDNFTKEMLKNTIRRDLAWLLNTLSFESAQDLSEHPEVQTSVLNFGVRDYAGRSRSSRSEMDNAKAIRKAILRFEPRLAKVTVSPDPEAVADQPGKVSYIIDANLSVGRDFIPIRLHTDIDVENSKVEVRE